MNKLKIFTKNFLNNLDRAEYNGGSASLMVSIIVCGLAAVAFLIATSIYLFGPISIILIPVAIALSRIVYAGVTGK